MPLPTRCVHYVAAELSRRGMIALPTVKNVPGYDIIVARVDGQRHANIQVKTSLRRTSFWPTPPSSDIRYGRNDFYVFVRVDKQQNFEAFMLTGRETKREVMRHELELKDRIRKGSRKAVRHSLYIGREKKREAKRWARRWQIWHL